MQLKAILRAYRGRLVFTIFLILSEAGLSLLFPLLIGKAVDDAIHHTYVGALQLGALGLLVLIISVGRRVYDSRLYAQIFEHLGSNMIAKTPQNNDSVKTARLHMLEEIVAFLEDTLPEFISQIIGLAGIVFILAFLNIQIFIGGLLALGLIFLIYVGTGPKTTQLNAAYNDELEKQVTVIAQKDPVKLSAHLKKRMGWNIKLSDLEALNFSLSWLILMFFLVASIILAAQNGINQYGALFALVMYVFQLIENIVVLPLYYQHWLRFSEIRQRLEDVSLNTNPQKNQEMNYPTPQAPSI